MSVQRFSHIGICVSDLARSTAFYRDALGFTELSGLKISGDASATLLDIEGGALEAVYLERDGVRIELLHYTEVGHIDIPGPRPMNQLGLSHLSLRVADLDTVLAAVEQHALAGHEITLFGGQEHGNALHILQLAKPTDRRTTARRVLKFLGRIQ